MGINRFETIYDNNWVQQYIPLPLDLIARQGAMKQKQYDDSIEEAYKMQDLMSKVNAIDKHQQYKRQLEDKYYAPMNVAADKIVKEGDMSALQEVKRLARQWERDPLRQELENSYSNYLAYQKDKIAKGDKYGEYYDPYIPFTGSNTDNTIAGFRYTGMGEVQDHQKLARDMMADIAADARSYDNVSLDANGNIIGTKGGRKYVLSDKVQNLATMKAKDFLQTKEGKDWLKQKQYYSPNATNEDIVKGAISYLYDAGANQIFSDISSGSDFKYAPEYIAKAKQEAIDAQNRFTTESGAVESAGSWTKVLGLEDYFNEDGSIKDVTGLNDSFKTSEDSPSLTGALNIELNTKDTKSTREEFMDKALSKLYATTSRLNLNVRRPDRTIDGEATKENLIKYGKGLSTYSNYTVAITDPTITKNISNDMFGKTSNIHNTEIYKQGDPSTASEFEGEDKKAQFKNSKAIGLDYTAAKPGAVKFVAPVEFDKNGNPITGDVPYIAIHKNKDLQDQMRPIQELTVKTIEGSKTGNPDPTAQRLTSYLRADQVKDLFGNTIRVDQLGIPVAATRDLDGTFRVSYLDTSLGTPLIQVLVQKPGSPLELLSLEDVQERKTGEIFNVGGALSQYQKQSRNTTLPSQDFED